MPGSMMIWINRISYFAPPKAIYQGDWDELSLLLKLLILV